MPQRTPSDAPDAQGSPSSRRRRRSSAIKQWIPTALFVAVVLALVLLLIAVRAMLAPSSRADAGTPVQVTGQAVSSAQPPIEQSAPPVADRSAQRPVKFTSQQVDPSYTVASGDNLWTIAEKNRTTVLAVQSINNLPEGVTLSVGQRLVMP